MTAKTLLAAACAALLGVHLWHSHRQAVFARQLQRMADVNGFVPVAPPANARPGTVVILAPINCPRAGAQRAAALANHLSEHGIPNVRSNEYAVTGAAADALLMKSTAAIATGTLPVVLFNGRGEDNPEPWRVVDEYRGAQR